MLGPLGQRRLGDRMRSNDGHPRGVDIHPWGELGAAPERGLAWSRSFDDSPIGVRNYRVLRARK